MENLKAALVSVEKMREIPKNKRKSSISRNFDKDNKLIGLSTGKGKSPINSVATSSLAQTVVTSDRSSVAQGLSSQYLRELDEVQQSIARHRTGVRDRSHTIASLLHKNEMDEQQISVLEVKQSALLKELMSQAKHE